MVRMRVGVCVCFYSIVADIIFFYSVATGLIAEMLLVLFFVV